MNITHPGTILPNQEKSFKTGLFSGEIIIMAVNNKTVLFSANYSTKEKSAFNSFLNELLLAGYIYRMPSIQKKLLTINFAFANIHKKLGRLLIFCSFTWPGELLDLERVIK